MIFDFYKMESERINQRTDWFLIFNAILLEVFFATDIVELQKFSILVFGVLVSYIWLVNGIRGWWKYGELSKKMRDEKIVGEKMADEFKCLVASRISSVPFWFNWARDAPSFSILIPLLCFILWLSFFVMKFTIQFFH